jgi:hypothetical protein
VPACNSKQPNPDTASEGNLVYVALLGGVVVAVALIGGHCQNNQVQTSHSSVVDNSDQV